MANLMSLPDCVGTGARMLDKIKPNWFRSVNLQTLDMYSPSNCIYGQLFGNITRLSGIFRNDPVKYGFVIADSSNHKPNEAWLLDFQWYMQITHRLHHN